MQLVAGIVCTTESHPIKLPDNGSLWLVRAASADAVPHIERVYDFPPYVFIDHYGDQHEMVDSDVSGWLLDGRVIVHVHQLGTWLREPDTSAPRALWPASEPMTDAVRDRKPFSVVHAGGATRTAYYALTLWLAKRGDALRGVGSDDRNVEIAPLAQFPQDAQVELRITHEGALVEVRARDDAQLALFLQRPRTKSFERVESEPERARLMAWFKLSPRTDGADLSGLREG
jgi:hypothetical protein